jgi:hypothetical protein
MDIQVVWENEQNIVVMWNYKGKAKVDIDIIIE